MKKDKKRGKGILIALIALVVVLIWAAINYYSIMNPTVEVKEPKVVFVEEPQATETEEASALETTDEEPKTTPATMMSGLECVDGKINFVLTNIADKEAKISDFIIMVSARINSNPDCGVVALKPGESTVCYNIGAVKSVGKKLVIVRYTGMSESDIVVC